MKKYLIITLLAVVAYFVLNSSSTENVWTQETPAYTPTPKQVQELPPAAQAYAEQLGIPLERLQYTKVVIGGTCSASGLAEGQAIACYRGDNTELTNGILTITSKVTPANARLVFAHEYMHQVWEEITPAQRSEYSTVTRALYAQYPKVRERVKDYQADQSVIDNELHSYICTEMADVRIPEPLKSHCITYLPNRNALPSYY